MVTIPVTEIRYSTGARCRRTFWNLRSTWIFLLAPIIFLVLPLTIPTQEARCGYVILLMLTYYLTEVIPISIVALIPLILLPLFKIVPPKELTKMYMKENVISFLGAVMVALCLQRWGISERLALWTLVKVGTDVKRLLFSIMCTTAFLSLWINNSPTAIMMVPIAKSVATEYLKQFSVKGEINGKQINGQVSLDMQLLDRNPETAEEAPANESNLDNEEQLENLSPEQQNVLKMFILSVPWCCNLGGAGSLYGTSVNLLLKANLESEFENPTLITFVNWAAFSLPCSVIMLALGWAWLQIYHLGWRHLFVCKRKTPQDLQKEANLQIILQDQYAKLGPMSFAEYAAVGHMATLALAWITMDPGFVRGWSSLHPKEFTSSYQPAILLVISMCVFPSEFPDFLRFWDKKKSITPHTPAPPLMDWKSINKLFPWSTLLLIGGCMALAEGIKISGLSLWIASNLVLLRELPPYALVMLSVTLVTFFTEFMSNSALLSIVYPIFAKLAVGFHIHPLYIMFPASVGAVYSFMMPTASPTNAIAYSFGVLNIQDMVKPGIVMNLFGIVVITFAVNTWGTALFQLQTVPPWAGGNDTTLNFNVTTL